ncbi:MAG: FHA domain-containing protein, partial [Candidatus Marinimicrobia bacterium]|nr:FHA domain-containing protein [Candidatus Neomarinimicrobiota bacterium]
MIIAGPEKGRRILLRPGVCELGRNPALGLALKDDEVSWLHARLDYAAGDLRITECGALNALRVNGAEVHEATLRDGDVLEVGRTQIKIRNLQGGIASQRRRFSTTQAVMALMLTLALIVQAVVVYHLL